MKRQIITISGKPASGKSTTAKALAAELGFGQFSSGSLFRELAAERGLDLLEANFTAEQNAEIDNLVDEKLQEIGKTGSELVIDSRLAWHWMPDSFKVLLDLDLNVAARRVLASADEARLASERIPNSAEEYARVLASRQASEIRRYKNLYDVNPYDETNYDLVVDTGKNDASAAAKLILDGYRKWLAS